jgi:hypothetical protein
MENIKKIKNNPVWVKFKRFCNEYKEDLNGKGLPGYKIEQFSKNLPKNEKSFVEDFLVELQKLNYLQVDAKKRIILTEKALKDLF